MLLKDTRRLKDFRKFKRLRKRDYNFRNPCRQAEGALRQSETRLKEANEELQKRNEELRRQSAELKEINKKLSDEKHLLHAVMEALPVGVFIGDKSGGAILNNKAYEMIWGDPRPETLSVENYSHYKAWWADTKRVVAPEEWASARAVQKGETTLGQLIRIRRFDGSEIFVINSAAPIYDSAGNIAGSAVAIQDVTGLKKVEKALYESEQRMRLFIEHAPVALAMFDCDMRCISANRRWLNDHGLVNRDLCNMSYYQAFPDIPEKWREVHRRGLAGEVVRAEEDRVELPNGAVQWVRWEIHPWYDNSGSIGGIVIMAEDITVRKQAKEQLQALNDELERRIELRTRELQETQAQVLHAEKLSAVGKLSASFAHEFNNPLQSILTVLQTLKKANLEVNDRAMVDLAINESHRIRDLILSLQDFSRSSPGRKVAMDVHAAIDRTLMLHRSDLQRKNISVETKYSDGLPRIYAIPDQIHQVIFNLLNNAVDACDKNGGVITISTWQEGQRIAVEIRDTGVGIEPEKIDLIFQPFYTTKPIVKGTGLGLSICHGIVQNHQGEIRLESQPNKGSTFTVLLPIKLVK